MFKSDIRKLFLKDQMLMWVEPIYKNWKFGDPFNFYSSVLF